MAILVGARAPDFSLPGWYSQAEGEFSLATQKGRGVVLVFYPGDDRLVCTRQMCAYSDNIADLHRFDSAVWGIAPQSVESHRLFSEGRRLRMPLLADAERRVARDYGIVGAFGLRRSVFIVNAEGYVAWRWVSTTNLTFPSAPMIKEALAAAT
jgi:peroxiredoxin Q/BCP